MERSFSIQFVSKITGINAHTIRAWEKRYSAVVPRRTDNGKRIYSQDNVDRLKKLHELVKLGNAISDVAKLDETELSLMYSDFVGNMETTGQHQKISVESIDINSTIQHLIMALKTYKMDIISHELDKVRNSLSSRDFALSVLTPLLAEVGKLVDNGMLSVGQEHALSSILKFQIGQIICKDQANQRDEGPSIVIATPEGELHDFGVMISALLCGHYNVKYYFIGANLPAEALAEACNKVSADYTLLGVSKSYQANSPQRLERYLQVVVDQIQEKNRILLGGDFNDPFQTYETSRLEVIPTIQTLDQRLADITQRSAV